MLTFLKQEWKPPEINAQYYRRKRVTIFVVSCFCLRSSATALWRLEGVLRRKVSTSSCSLWLVNFEPSPRSSEATWNWQCTLLFLQWDFCKKFSHLFSLAGECSQWKRCLELTRNALTLSRLCHDHASKAHILLLTGKAELYRWVAGAIIGNVPLIIEFRGNSDVALSIFDKTLDECDQHHLHTTMALASRFIVDAAMKSGKDNQKVRTRLEKFLKMTPANSLGLRAPTPSYLLLFVWNGSEGEVTHASSSGKIWPRHGPHHRPKRHYCCKEGLLQYVWSR